MKSDRWKRRPKQTEVEKKTQKTENRTQENAIDIFTTLCVVVPEQQGKFEKSRRNMTNICDNRLIVVASHPRDRSCVEYIYICDI